eukprot:tig00000912_g5423.t1
MSTPEALREKLEGEVVAFRNMQKNYAKLIQSRNTFLSQQNENEMVKKELDILESDAAVYKLIGPALIKQDLSEVKGNVAKRLEFIGSELARIDKQMKVLETQQESKQQDLLALQKRLQTLTVAQK